MSDDRITDPDARSPYEHILGELNEIKELCRLTHNSCTARVEAVERWQFVSVASAVAAFALAACTFVR